MSGATKIHDSLVQALGRIQGELALELVILQLTKDAGSVEELVPGMKLVPRKMSSAERSKLMNAAGAVARAKQAEARHASALPVVTQALAENPAISLRGLGLKLDAAGIKPLRAKKWSAAAVLFLLRSSGLREPPAP